jgi:hypothetical protein
MEHVFGIQGSNEKYPLKALESMVVVGKQNTPASVSTNCVVPVLALILDLCLLW